MSATRTDVSPDGQRLFTIDEGLVHSDLGRLDVRAQVGWRGPVSASAWTADRTQAIVAGGDALRLIDTSSGSTIRRIDFESVADWQAAVAPDGLTVAVKRCRFAESVRRRAQAIGARIDIVSLETGAIVRTLRSATEEPCGFNFTFSGDGSRLVESVELGDHDAGLRIWNVQTGRAQAAR